MSIITDKFLIETEGFSDIIDVTNQVQSCVQRHGIREGVVHVYVVGSTASITTLEYEPGLVQDMKDMLEIIAPINKDYAHDNRWHDGNGFSHIRASIIGNSVTLPLINYALELGTWQQVVLIDFDNKKRSRNIYIQIVS